MDYRLPRWSARNPLGIIALFISLIYGMSALLLGTSVDSLATSNQTILVCFVVSFPFVVLGVFAWFVAKHHKKLYGPADFRSDEAFHAVRDLPPADLGRRLSQEIEQDIREPTVGVIVNSRDGAQPSRPSLHTDLPGENRGPGERGAPVQLPRETRARQTDLFARAFVAEALVFQELQRDFGGAIRRQVALPLWGGGRFRADGVIQVENGVIIVEVKLVRSVSNLKNRLDHWIRSIQVDRRSMDEKQFKCAQFILAIVYDGSPQRDQLYNAIKKYQNEVGSAIEIRLFFFQDLARKYGIPLAHEKEEEEEEEAEPTAAKGC